MSTEEIDLAALKERLDRLEAERQREREKAEKLSMPAPRIVMSHRLAEMEEKQDKKLEARRRRAAEVAAHHDAHVERVRPEAEKLERKIEALQQRDLEERERSARVLEKIAAEQAGLRRKWGDMMTPPPPPPMPPEPVSDDAVEMVNASMAYGHVQMVPVGMGKGRR